MKFSIIIATLNRLEEPLLMLDSLINQSLKDFEVILIDQNDKELITEDKLNRYKSIFDLKRIKTNTRGASNARNIGILNAKGEILTFPDDDCEFYPKFLEEINNYFEQNNVDGILTTSKDKYDGKAISVLMSKKPQIINKKNLLKTVVEFAIIIKANRINNIVFDPDMGVGSPTSPYWSDEGPDFVLRLIQQGVKFKFCPQFYIFHPNPVKKYNDKTALRSYRYGIGRGYFIKKHNFGLKVIFYYLSIYIVGMMKAIISLNPKMFKYFRKGFKGRYEGYFLSK